MRRVICVFLVAVCGCSAEVASPKPENSATEPDRDYSYPSENVKGPDCIPTLTLTTIENGKEVTKEYHFPCAGPTGPSSPASDPPGWGTDNESDVDVGSISIGDIRHDPTIDPIPNRR